MLTKIKEILYLDKRARLSDNGLVMPVMFSRGCEYALQAMLYLATQQANKPVFQREISQALKIPTHFLGKILQALVRNRLVVSTKGKGGGFTLGREPSKIAIKEIIQAIDGPVFLDGCVLGFPGCSDDSPCPLHGQWKEIKSRITETLLDKNVEQLSRELDTKFYTVDPLLSTLLQK